MATTDLPLHEEIEFMALMDALRVGRRIMSNSSTIEAKTRNSMMTYLAPVHLRPRVQEALDDYSAKPPHVGRALNAPGDTVKAMIPLDDDALPVGEVLAMMLDILSWNPKAVFRVGPSRSLVSGVRINETGQEIPLNLATLTHALNSLGNHVNDAKLIFLVQGDGVVYELDQDRAWSLTV